MNRPAALLAVIAAALPGAAHASAWTQPQGAGQVIVTGVYSHSAKGFDAKGDTIDIDDYTKAEAYVLAEYGVTDDLTVMAIPSFSPRPRRAVNSGTSGTASDIGTPAAAVSIASVRLSWVYPSTCGKSAAAISTAVAAITGLSGAKPLVSGR